MPAWLVPAIGAAAALGGSAINAISQSRQNRKSREYADAAYQKERLNNIEFWKMQNEYNSPTQQMARLRAGGLSPQLAYGSASASGPAGNLSTPDQQSAQFRTPEWGNAMSSAGLTFMNAMYELDIKQAQVDNLKADNTVKLTQAALLAAQTSRSEFDLQFESDLQKISADARRESLRKLKVSTDVLIRDDERRAIQNSRSVAESIEKVLNMRAQRANTEEDKKRIRATVANLKKDSALKQLDIDLRKKGINPNDPMWTRVLGRLLNEYVGKVNNNVAPAKKKSLLDLILDSL